LNLFEFQRFTVYYTPYQFTIYVHLVHVTTTFQRLNQSDLNPFVENEWLGVEYPVAVTTDGVGNTDPVRVHEDSWHPFAYATTITTCRHV
jgi:hypothetical protein